MKSLLTLVFSLLFLMLGGGAVYGFIFINSAAGSSDEVVLFDVPPGSSFGKVTQELKQKGLISNVDLFKIYARLVGATRSLHVGEYSLQQSMTPREIVEVLAEGKSVVHLVTFPEGFNIFEISETLEAKWPGRGEEFLEAAKDKKKVQETLGIKAGSFEGYLFPDTYSITKYTTAKEIVQMMVKRFEETYKEIIQGPKKINMKRHDHVIFASVVEKETGAPQERPMISSVFHNRLVKNMRLQSDPTIIYGQWVKTGKYLKNIRKKHIRQPTPYNTYTVKALPAGPVSNPGRESLIAALNPAQSEFLYFVSKNDGTHVFSKTLKEHNENVRVYQLNKDARKGKSWRNLKRK